MATVKFMFHIRVRTPEGSIRHLTQADTEKMEKDFKKHFQSPEFRGKFELQKQKFNVKKQTLELTVKTKEMGLKELCLGKHKQVHAKICVDLWKDTFVAHVKTGKQNDMYVFGTGTGRKDLEKFRLHDGSTYVICFNVSEIVAKC